MRDDILELLETAIDSVFEEMQRREGITSGDVSPLHHLLLNKRKNDLAFAIEMTLKSQKGE